MERSLPFSTVVENTSIVSRRAFSLIIFSFLFLVYSLRKWLSGLVVWWKKHRYPQHAVVVVEAVAVGGTEEDNMSVECDSGNPSHTRRVSWINGRLKARVIT
jgi:hypothetical protein